jgi:hypothetical protein
MPSFQPQEKAAEALGVHWSWLRDRRLQGRFIENVHFIRVPGVRSYCYNVPLIARWIDVGGDPARHQRDVDAYLIQTGQMNPSKRKAGGRG